MSKKLYVGNLPFKMTEDELHSLFSGHGQVTSARIITDKYSGRSKGFGFVEMENDTEAAAAIEAVSKNPIDGRTLVVNEARPMEERRPGGGGKRFGGRSSSGGGGGRFGDKKRNRY
ncbi:RNA-binding protein [bacterium]|nr:RNA-binding protein [bacterium]